MAGAGDLGRPAVPARPRPGVRALRRWPTRVGRFWIEYLRIDDANHFLGLRLNDWTSILVFLGALVYFVLAQAAPGPRGDVPPALGDGRRPDGAEPRTASPGDRPLRRDASAVGMSLSSVMR